LSDSFEKRWATVGAPAKAALNGGLFYACWVIILFYAVIERPYVSLGVVFPFMLAHSFLTDNGRRDLILLPSLVVSGTILDSLMMNFGVITFVAPNDLFPWMCPIWIIVLHLVFASSINLSMTWLSRSYFLAAGFGGIGAPVSYYMGAQVGAAVLLMGMQSCLIIGVAWAIYLPLIYIYSKWLDRKLG